MCNRREDKSSGMPRWNAATTMQTDEGLRVWRGSCPPGGRVKSSRLEPNIRGWRGNIYARMRASLVPCGACAARDLSRPPVKTYLHGDRIYTPRERHLPRREWTST